MPQKLEDRILFLKEFTRQLIINSKQPGVEIHMKETEEFPILTIKPFIESELEKTEPLIKPMTKPLETIPKIIPLIKPIFLPQIPRYIKPITPIKPQISAPSPLAEYKPAPTKIPERFDLGKINFLISDPRVTLIECPGPDKLVIARASGQSTMTRVSLTQKEIQELIDKFSKEAKIPIISGLFKAAVGSLVMTAVISDLVGSRFIITKITPSFILEQKEKF